MTRYKEIITTAYANFNKRDIDGVLDLMTPDVTWPNGWEGGFVHGYEEIREYWTRQWKEINPVVEPLNVTETSPNEVTVLVHQLVKDLNGNTVADVKLNHVYHFEKDKITSMTIE